MQLALFNVEEYAGHYAQPWAEWECDALSNIFVALAEQFDSYYFQA